MGKRRYADVLLRVFGSITLISALLLSGVAYAAFEPVTTYQDERGWKLQVDGRDFFVKGVVWGYTPRGQNYTYDLWRQPQERIKSVIDHDFELMHQAGVTAVRSFTIIPPEWVQYIYETYGIYSVVNPLMGRYGATIGGVWRPKTNYSDALTRETLKSETVAIVEHFKDVPGVLMFAFGNENNYGLEWSSFEIENLPVDEQHREKAKYLYSLYSEIIAASKEIAPQHVFAIVNGDIQYLDLIAEAVQNMDLLGINAYRGLSFEGDPSASLWRDVKQGFDRPVLFMEFGSDAFNAKHFVEDEAAQAHFLRLQWLEIYNKSYGNGQEGNAIGGFVFEWRDEWWKYKQTENLDVHDRNASWENGGYRFDYVQGQNNMNEEWFGITRLGEVNSEGVYIAEPRLAYDVLSQLWRTDPYQPSGGSIDSGVGAIDLETAALKSSVRALQSAKKESEKFSVTGGNISGELIVQGRDNDIEEDGQDGLRTTSGLMANIDFAFQPTNRISGDFTINVLADVANSDFEFRYGDRGLPVTIDVSEEDTFGVTTTRAVSFEGNERVEIYDFQASYISPEFDFLAFYHVPRYHWGYEGDFFGLLRETTDIEGQDIWNAKAPYGVEYAGKGSLAGLKVVLGPEVYWGANPKGLIKYQFDVYNVDYALVYADDISRRSESTGATEATSRQERQLAFSAKKEFSGGAKLELGALIANDERVDERYDRVDGDNIILDEIEAEDTLGLKANWSFGLGSLARAYIAGSYAGLVADGGAPLREFGTKLPYSSQGNKREIEGGVMFTNTPYTFFPRVLVRENLVDANPSIAAVTTGTTLSQGISPRNRDDDAFAVLDNRAATSAEFIFTYDPTPATSFYAWNVDTIEDAAFAYNVGVTATRYDTATDAYLFFSEVSNANASFSDGLAAADVWLFTSKMVFNPSHGLRIVANFEAGRQQTTGLPGVEPVDFYSIDSKFIVRNKHIFSGYLKIDDYGPYDFQRQFNIVYPEQLKFEYTRLLDDFKDEKNASKYGVKLLYRTLGPLSPAEEYQDGANDYMFEVQSYIKLQF